MVSIVDALTGPLGLFFGAVLVTLIVWELAHVQRMHRKAFRERIARDANSVPVQHGQPAARVR